MVCCRPLARGTSCSQSSTRKVTLCGPSVSAREILSRSRFRCDKRAPTKLLCWCILRACWTWAMACFNRVRCWSSTIRAVNWFGVPISCRCAQPSRPSSFPQRYRVILRERSLFRARVMVSRHRPPTRIVTWELCSCLEVILDRSECLLRNMVREAKQAAPNRPATCRIKRTTAGFRWDCRSRGLLQTRTMSAVKGCSVTGDGSVAQPPRTSKAEYPTHLLSYTHNPLTQPSQRWVCVPHRVGSQRKRGRLEACIGYEKRYRTNHFAMPIWFVLIFQVL